MSQQSTILIVDDTASVRETMIALLRAPNYQILLSSSGAQALSIARATAPDLILLDVMMPEMDGFDVCRQLRADAATGHLPIILVTALDDRESRIHGIEAGADDFIAKPFDRVELRARVQTILRLHRYRHLLIERENLARLIEYAPDGMLIVDQHGVIVLANPAMVRLFGAMHQDDLLGKPIASFLALDQRDTWQAKLNRVIGHTDNTLQVETALMPLTNTRLPLEMHIGHFEWSEQPAAQIIARDITERKRAELLEEERHQIAYELHDGLAQTVTSAHQHLQAFAAHHRPRSPQARAALDHVLELARGSVREVRRVIAGLRPTALEDFGLADAIQIHVAALRAEGWEIAYRENIGARRLTPAVEIALFRITQEALTNARKHAQTTRIELTLEHDAPMLRLAIRDWGCGFEAMSIDRTGGPGERIGLRGMRERARLLGGQLRIQSSLGNGTLVVAEIPLEANSLTRLTPTPRRGGLEGLASPSE
jgi:PAS domain S-box-containing protein